MTRIQAHNTQAAYSTSPMLDQLDCIRHGFFGSTGGVSQGDYQSLNCGHSSDDVSESVTENRRRVAHKLGLQEQNLYSLRQAHTTKVVHIEQSSESQFNTCADGLVCNEAGIGLGALGADCAPVLFVDSVNRVIGAAHSGWKGALLGINEAVIRAMLDLGAELENIHAAIGPAMQQKHYEVKTDFEIMFADKSPLDSTPFFNLKAHKLYFDTPSYIHARLLEAGIGFIDQSNEDTFSQPNKYFSYRRTCQSGASDYGRQISVISLRP